MWFSKLLHEKAIYLGSSPEEDHRYDYYFVQEYDEYEDEVIPRITIYILIKVGSDPFDYLSKNINRINSLIGSNRIIFQAGLDLAKNQGLVF